ncbi:MAG: hypothetical protein P8Z80_16590 [Pseudolabrys sp.]
MARARGAGFACDLRLLVRRHRGDDVRSPRFGELDDVLADRSGAAGDEHGLVQPLVLVSVRQRHSVDRGHRRDAEAGSFLEAHAAGGGTASARRQRDVLRRRAERAPPLAVPHPDAVADARGRHAGTVALRDDAQHVARRTLSHCNDIPQEEVRAMHYRVYSGPRGSDDISPLAEGKMLFKEFATVDQALAWSCHVEGGGRTPILIEGDDVTWMDRRAIADALGVGHREQVGR